MSVWRTTGEVIGAGKLDQLIAGGMGFALVGSSTQIGKSLCQRGDLVLSFRFANSQNQVV